MEAQKALDQDHLKMKEGLAARLAARKNKRASVMLDQSRDKAAAPSSGHPGDKNQNQTLPLQLSVNDFEESKDN